MSAAGAVVSGWLAMEVWGPQVAVAVAEVEATAQQKMVVAVVAVVAVDMVAQCPYYCGSQTIITQGTFYGKEGGGGGGGGGTLPRQSVLCFCFTRYLS